MEVRALAADEGQLLSRVRLRALADSPRSFASVIDEERALTAAEWSQRAAASDQVVFVALSGDGEPVGMAGGRRHGDTREVIAVWGMWVAPAVRGTGLGARLLDAVAGWAGDQGAARLRLGVMADVPASVRFYERLGFQRTGEPRALRRDPSRRWHEMIRPLSPTARP